VSAAITLAVVSRHNTLAPDVYSRLHNISILGSMRVDLPSPCVKCDDSDDRLTAADHAAFPEFNARELQEYECDVVGRSSSTVDQTLTRD
jgi:hypothetical protein